MIHVGYSRNALLQVMGWNRTCEGCNVTFTIAARRPAHSRSNCRLQLVD